MYRYIDGVHVNTVEETLCQAGYHVTVLNECETAATMLGKNWYGGSIGTWNDHIPGCFEFEGYGSSFNAGTGNGNINFNMGGSYGDGQRGYAVCHTRNRFIRLGLSQERASGVRESKGRHFKTRNQNACVHKKNTLWNISLFQVISGTSIHGGRGGAGVGKKFQKKSVVFSVLNTSPPLGESKIKLFTKTK